MKLTSEEARRSTFCFSFSPRAGVFDYVRRHEFSDYQEALEAAKVHVVLDRATEEKEEMLRQKERGREKDQIKRG